jgi:hypothetical protein
MLTNPEPCTGRPEVGADAQRDAAAALFAALADSDTQLAAAAAAALGHAALRCGLWTHDTLCWLLCACCGAASLHCLRVN